MPRSRQRLRLEAGPFLKLPKLIRQRLVLPGQRVGPTLICWTYAGTDMETARGYITADLTGTVQGWVRLQIDGLDQWIELRAQPRRFGGRQWYFECPDTGKLVTLSGIRMGRGASHPAMHGPGRLPMAPNLKAGTTGL